VGDRPDRLPAPARSQFREVVRPEQPRPREVRLALLGAEARDDRRAGGPSARAPKSPMRSRTTTAGRAPRTRRDRARARRRAPKCRRRWCRLSAASPARDAANRVDKRPLRDGGRPEEDPAAAGARAALYWRARVGVLTLVFLWWFAPPA
jgi:hypothetical protein